MKGTMSAAAGRRVGGAVSGRPGAAGALALGNNANNSSGPGQLVTGESPEQREARQGRRAQRWSLRSRLRPVTSLKRVRACGRVPVTTEGGPTLRVSLGANGRPLAGYAGLSTCGSVWACPRCAAKVSYYRAGEVARVMRWAMEQGGSAALITLTSRHHSGDALKRQLEASAYAWSKVTSGRGWKRDQNRAGGILGWVRVLEITHGRNGWHPHFHILVLFKEDVELDVAERLADGMHDRWSAALARKGFESWRELGGLDVRMASLDSNNLADYFTKIAREVTASYAKVARSGSRSPFAIARDAVETYKAEDIHLWWEYENATRGRRQLTWSVGLRRQVLMDEAEKDDETVAAETTPGEDAVQLPAETWQAIVDTPAQTDLLDAVEDQADEAAGVLAAMLFLDRRRLAYTRVRNVVADEVKERTWRSEWRMRRTEDARRKLASLDDPWDGDSLR